MRKNIMMYCQDGKVINFTDDDEKPINEYAAKMAKIFESPNYVILETSSGVVVVNPNKLIGFEITEEPEKLSLDLDDNVIEKNQIKVKNEIKPKKVPIKKKTRKSQITTKKEEEKE